MLPGWTRILSDPASLPLWVLVGLFALSAVLAWRAGYRLARTTETLGRRLGINRAFAGMMLLGLASTLPAIAASVTGAVTGDAPVAVNNVLGGAAFGVVLLAAADARAGRVPITTMADEPAILLQATLSAMALVLAALMVLVGETFTLWRFGLGSILITVFTVFGVWLSSKAEVKWDPSKIPREGHPSRKRRRSERSTLAVAGIFLASAAVALVAGYALTRTAQGIADVTGLGHSFVGALFVGVASSLPTLSAVLAAVGLGAPDLAVSSAFGSNLVAMLILPIADAFYPPGAILVAAGTFAAATGLLATLLTGVYLVGLLSRRTRQVLGLGYDSWATVVLYLVGAVALYRLM